MTLEFPYPREEEVVDDEALVFEFKGGSEPPDTRNSAERMLFSPTMFPCDTCCSMPGQRSKHE
jgi:hypothetical protein